MKMSNLKVSTKLLVGFGVLLLAMVTVGSIGILRLSEMNQRMGDLATRKWQAARSALEMDARQRDNFAQSGLLLLSEASARSGILEQISANKTFIGQAFDTLEKSVDGPDARAKLSESLDARKHYVGALERLTAAANSNELQEATRIYHSELAPLLQDSLEKNRSLVDLQEKAFDDAYQLALADYGTAKQLILAVMAAALCLGALLAYRLLRGIVPPLKNAVAAAEAITAGRYDNTIDVGGEDEPGILLRSLDTMQGALRERDARDADYRGQIAAIDSSQAVIAFGLDGNVLDANENFLRTLGYSLAEIKGKHHSMFVDSSEHQGPQYRQFWEKLGRGQYDAGVYKRIGKGGREVWIQASYNPIKDVSGKPVKVVKFATDITEQKSKNADFEGKLAAIDKVQAVIEFELDGTIRTANENFLKTLGYSLGEIKGKHHSLFVEAASASSPDYRAFWQKLGRGEYDAGQYLRIGKGGREVWIQASYNPIFDASGRPIKVVKYATDVTEQVRLSRELQSAVSDIQGTIQSAGDGKLTQRVPLDGKTGEIASLCAGVNSLLENTCSLVRRVKTATSEVTTGAEEISKGNTNLSQRTEEQASSLEETASSMEEMTSTVRQTADNAGQANQLAMAARQQAEKGGTVVGAAVQAMSGINDASKKIADIIGVIDEIAFQTNLLALNAAVEAARAGEQGRGFAVVATEVRNLAGRSATAAKEIKGLIQDSVSRVEQGSKLVDESGKTLEEIVGAVKKVSDIVAEIAAASREQSSGIEQVNKAVMQMDTTTQQNAALVEEAAAASQSIVEQAQALNGMISRYDVGSETEVASAAPAKVERRKASRPWSGGAKPGAAAPSAPAARKVAAVSGDSTWNEF